MSIIEKMVKRMYSVPLELAVHEPSGMGNLTHVCVESLAKAALSALSEVLDKRALDAAREVYSDALIDGGEFTSADIEKMIKVYLTNLQDGQ